jgi:predicted CoA-binding protein
MTRELIDRFLAAHRIAIAGVSRNPRDFSRSLFGEFVKRGYDVVPVHPEGIEVDGRACFRRLQEVEPKVEAVLLMTSPEQTGIVVKDCADAGVPLVWMYRATGAGAVSETAVEYCQAHGIDCIAGYCPYMFFSKSGFPHVVHRFFKQLTGTFPQAA